MDFIPSPPFLFLLPSSQPLCSLVMLHSLTLENLTDCVSAKDASRLQRTHNSSTVYLPSERRSSHKKEWWAALSKPMFYSCPPQRYVRWFLRLWENILVLLQGDVGSVDLKPPQGSDSHNLEVPAPHGAPPAFQQQVKIALRFSEFAKHAELWPLVRGGAAANCDATKEEQSVFPSEFVRETRCTPIL